MATAQTTTTMGQRWFHPHLPGPEAEKLLKEKGRDGSFLVRPSQSNPGDFTLSVRQSSTQIAHIRIQNTGDFYDLYGGETFATLDELIEHYVNQESELREASGNLITLKYPLPCDDPATERCVRAAPRTGRCARTHVRRWYHGSIAATTAEDILMERLPDGSMKYSDGAFLVRASRSKPGDLVISVLNDPSVAHIIVKSKATGFHVEDERPFSAISDLVAYYRDAPLMEESGNILHLRTPVHTSRMTMATIAARVAELERTTNNAYGKTGFWEEFQYLQLSDRTANRATVSRKEGSRPHNRAKNRYKNILPCTLQRQRAMMHRHPVLRRPV